MLEILLTAIVAFIVAFLAIPVVILIADKKKLYDIPDERKLHTHAIASLGGVGVFIGFLFAGLLCTNLTQSPEVRYFYAAAVLVFFIGLKDDIIALSATKKFVAQILAAAIIVHLGGIRIENMYGILGIGPLDAMIGVPLTYFVIILIINAYNLIDGIDGLSGSLGLMASLLFGTYFYLAKMHPYAAFSFSLSAALVGFLIFNYHPAKIFMGDSGSLLIGMVVSVLVLKFINVASDPAAALPIPSAVAVGISILIVPLVDTIRVFGNRIMRGRSPFSPDRNHVHHLLIDRGLGHSAVTLICVSSNILLVLVTYLTRSLGNTFLIIALFGTAFIALGMLYYTLPKRKLVIHRRYIINQARQQQKLANAKHSKVINIQTKETIQEQVH
ncbi:undecaprenyl-phosphate alpha-N-acetylglucosaminyl 1-phosphate transferase [Niabella ginsenosidivorans]|uniref:Undecaprenyl-phosphate alpha-N-acetylglucosaminyl 1-phosphate transferase n=1 Tax=Niabella ginsenosidivorans TaxID=1176587 RepID=A0A1A9HW26_9BACT|nr:MraY family glycosyltransferase [Niabella ginsenosidivorans]ANH79586.1 undecaprenyl-phosphate alpha-N-acetylglucosaminyl 1-phosphate transferase [Niabella ginsenosidivorans]